MDQQEQLLRSDQLIKIVRAINLILGGNEQDKSRAKQYLFGIVSEEAFEMVYKLAQQQAAKAENVHYFVRKSTATN